MERRYMTRTYYTANGEYIDINVTGNLFLDKLTFGLWDKIGIPRPLSKSDTRLVARLLRNYATLQRRTLGEDHNYAWQSMGFEQDDIKTIEWTEKIARFFEFSDGLIDENEMDEFNEEAFNWYPEIHII